MVMPATESTRLPAGRWQEVGKNDIRRCLAISALAAPVASGAGVVMELFEVAAYCVVELLCGAPEEERTGISPVETEEKQT